MLVFISCLYVSDKCRWLLKGGVGPYFQELLYSSRKYDHMENMSVWKSRKWKWNENSKHKAQMENGKGNSTKMHQSLVQCFLCRLVSNVFCQVALLYCTDFVICSVKYGRSSPITIDNTSCFTESLKLEFICFIVLRKSLAFCSPCENSQSLTY